MGKKLKFYFEYTIIKIFMVLFRFIPESLISLSVPLFSRLIYYILPYRKLVIKKQLHLAFPDLTFKKQKILIIKIYEHLVFFIFEFILLFKWKNQKILEMTDLDENEHLMEIKKKGGIFLSGHFSNWEIYMRGLCIRGYPLSAIMAKQKNRLVNRLIENWRNDVGMETIYPGDALKKSISALNNKRIICIMGDQDARKRGVFSPFFGEMSSTHIGAALMAYRLDKPVMIGFAVREKFGKYRSLVFPVDVNGMKAKSNNDKEQFIQLFIDNYNRTLQKIVTQYPDQYFWFHKRWKTPYKGKKIVNYSK